MTSGSHRRSSPVRGRFAALAGCVVALIGLVACSPKRPDVLPPSTATGPPPVYVAVGASETTGQGSDQPLRDGWPRVLHRTALPEGAVFINMGIPGATVAQAINEEMNQALVSKPNLVTVWLNVNDIIHGVSAADFERQLDTLVKTLRGGGAIRVLVANTPPLDNLPAYKAGRLIPGVDAPTPEQLRQVVDDYNAATARVVEREGALLVDLHAVLLAAEAAGTEAALISRDGFHPSTAGHAAVAAAFADVLRASGPLVVPSS
ncbi:MAG TPA: SGNH/GDSL hydrolase family protein [Acidimicrobiales bacterium]|jgi:lysophospholipase L1-like esterase|nr:SGNH/GDSL hydrolase family protein [Acidimicrobiales bacterium]